MRKLLVGCVAASIFGLSTAAAASAQAPAQDSVSGTAALITYNAQSGPSGENPTGYVESAAPPFVRVPVTCLAVTANRATIGVDIFGSHQYLFVEDNGGSGSDRATPFGTPADDPSVCPTDPPPVSSAILQPVNGDIVVVDATPFPTSKDQCENGGWRNYGTAFKNQGQCVAFLQRGTKSAP